MSEFKDDFNEQEFLEKVKKAAEEGAKRGIQIWIWYRDS